MNQYAKILFLFLLLIEMTKQAKEKSVTFSLLILLMATVFFTLGVT